ncbi:hypothetical protein [Mesobacillus maritimus]|nr:hypothetical protein [Mesobacillus maritimus]
MKMVQKEKNVNTTKIVINTMILVSTIMFVTRGYKIWDITL